MSHNRLKSVLGNKISTFKKLEFNTCFFIDCIVNKVWRDKNKCSPDSNVVGLFYEMQSVTRNFYEL